MLAIVFVTSCATSRQDLEAGGSRLIIQVLPEPYGKWQAAKVYLNGQYIETAVPGNDQISYDLAPGKYTIKVITDGYETCEENVSLVEGKKQQYIELRPKKSVNSDFMAAVKKFFSK